MKEYIAILLIFILIVTAFSGCSSRQLVTEGCRVIRDDGEYVTYQTVCDNCGYEFGSPTTIYAYNTYYSVVCTLCGELNYVRINRK